MNDNISCPVDFVKVNENKTRITAFIVILVTALFLVTGSWWIMLILSIDFFLRAFKLNKYSPLDNASSMAVKLLSVKNIPVDRAPKRFAAKIGCLFASVITIVDIFGNVTIANILAYILILFAFLESAFAVCVGCYMYTFLLKVKVLKK